MSKVVAVEGSYRPGGNTDRLVEAVLEGARQSGAETEIIHLIDHPIEFCTNCRQCTQAPGADRQRCTKDDGLGALIERIEAADALVFASPVNYWNTTAIFRRFLERTLGSAYWPWGQAAPKIRSKQRPRRAVLIATSAMPGLLIPLATGTARALSLAAASFGARVVGRLWVGLRVQEPNSPLSPRTLARARKLGHKLVG